MRPGGVYDTSYSQALAIIRTNFHWVMTILFFLFLFTIPIYLSNIYILSVINVTAITLIAVLGLNLVNGYCGQIHIGQAAFVGVGAYSSAILSTKLGFPFWISAPAAILLTGIIGTLLAGPSLRIKGFYFALITIAAQTFLGFIFLHAEGLTGGPLGIQAPEPSLGGLVFDSERSFFYLIIIATVISGLAAKNIARSYLGRSFVALRDNDIAAEAMGINLFRQKVIAFFISSCYGGLAGALWAHYMGAIHPEHFTLMDSIYYLAMLIIGGMGTTMGAVFGVVAWQLLHELMSVMAPVVGSAFPALAGQASAALTLAAFGIVIIIFLIYEPRGLNHAWINLKNYFQTWPFSY